MNNAFIYLDNSEQQEIIVESAKQLGRAPQVLEKDVWLCWVLQVLFTMPNAHPMAFKGGTSLSKVYNVIDRFSEDVDITLDYQHFELDEDLSNINNLSGRKKRQLSEELTKKVKIYAQETILPYLQSEMKKLPNSDLFGLSIDEKGEKIYFTYPAVSLGDGYVRDNILIELGGRNVVDPHQTSLIKPYLAQVVPELDYPCGNVVVLSAQRTFWEKITLAHYECNRNGLRENADRLSRHWYDLVMLSRHDIGKQAINNRPLLTEVVEHKKIFFNSSYADYDACLEGGVKLLPEHNSLQQLKIDYNNMLRSNLMYQTPPSFGEIIAEIKTLEKMINTQ